MLATDGEVEEPSPGFYPLTDLGNAQRLMHRHGKDLRYCHLWRKWLAWDEGRWALDRRGEAARRMIDTVRSIYGEAQQCEDADLRAAVGDWAHKSEAVQRVEGALTLARSLPGVPILPEALDADPWLLNVPNGTLDLRDGRLRPHRREDLLTKLCPTPYDPDAACPVWLAALAVIFQRDGDLIRFLQRFFGRALTGDVTEQILAIFWGSGANGKSTVLNAVLDVLGRDYAMKANQGLLTVARGERHPTELASLFGKRLVVASETDQGQRLNEALVKDMTGGEPLTARRMREDFWEFKQTHKVILCTNHKPQVRGTDHAIWRRLRLVPFEVTFWNPDDLPNGEDEGMPSERKQDKRLGEKLAEEHGGVLAWMVRGCLDWQREGLTLPDKVRAATEKYRDEEDQMSRFLVECCHQGVNYTCRGSHLYARYKAWAEALAESLITSRAFGDYMTTKFKKRISNGVRYDGVMLQAPEAPDNDRRNK